MVRILLDHDLSTEVAVWFGPDITRVKAGQVRAKAEGLAAARNVAHIGDFSMTVGRVGQDHRVVMSVEGRHADGSSAGEVASFVEWGQLRNPWSGKPVAGKHIMRDAIS
ncbi:hypothetical protein [Bifidobacterium tissieri]|uniref:hypothetical protein n=1 Tax=Bifidobacterium tissieri TaxID=1630162 RepID=UPI00123A58D2|nr:hypothetical protein [Bifidobacterium tissieri]KAA8829336.1 hypothetical protein EM849_11050 [Bifidobacterium tissieri]